MNRWHLDNLVIRRSLARYLSVVFLSAGWPGWLHAEPLAVLAESERAASPTDTYVYLWVSPRESDGQKISVHEVRVLEAGLEQVSFRGENLEKIADPASVFTSAGSIYTFSNRPGQRVEAIGVGRGSVLCLRLPLSKAWDELEEVRISVQFWHGNGMTPFLRASLEPDPSQAVVVASGLAEAVPTNRLGWAGFTLNPDHLKAIREGSREPIEGTVRP